MIVECADIEKVERYMYLLEIVHIPPKTFLSKFTRAGIFPPRVSIIQKYFKKTADTVLNRYIPR